MISKVKGPILDGGKGNKVPSYVKIPPPYCCYPCLPFLNLLKNFIGRKKKFDDGKKFTQLCYLFEIASLIFFQSLFIVSYDSKWRTFFDGNTSLIRLMIRQTFWMPEVTQQSPTVTTIGQQHQDDEV